jgi:hypothetical protein
VTFINIRFLSGQSRAEFNCRVGSLSTNRGHRRQSVQLHHYTSQAKFVPVGSPYESTFGSVPVNNSSSAQIQHATTHCHYPLFQNDKFLSIYPPPTPAVSKFHVTCPTMPITYL